MENAEYKIIDNDSGAESVETVTTNNSSQNDNFDQNTKFKVSFKDWMRYKLRKLIIIIILATLTVVLYNVAVAISTSEGLGVWLWIFLWNHILGLWILVGICGIATIFNFIGLFKRIDPMHFQMWKDSLEARRAMKK